jgi:hypothetical protein
MKVQAEVVGWSLLPIESGLSGLHHNEKTIPKGFAEADYIIQHQ